MEPSPTLTRENEQSIAIVSESPHVTPICVPNYDPVTPPSSTHDGGHPIIPPFSIPWIIEEDGACVDLTPPHPAIVVEQSITSLSSDKYQYWIRVIGMETMEGAPKATRMIQETYVGKIVYLESEKPLDQFQMIHATWAALNMWHKTGTISGLLIGYTPLHMRTVDHRDPPLLSDTFTPSLSCPPVVSDSGLPIPLTPSRPTFTIEKIDINMFWMRIIDMEPIKASSIITATEAERNTRTIKDSFIGKIVYLEWLDPPQGCDIDLATWTALMIWHKASHKFGLGLRIGRTPIDVETVDPKPLYEPPFKLTDIPDYESANISLIPMKELVFLGPIVLPDGSLSQNVDAVTRRSGSIDAPLNGRMIHKKMTPETSTDDMIYEAKTYVALSECEHAPKLLGVVGDAVTGECRGLLIEFIEGRPMYPIPFMFNNMRLEITMQLVKAMVEFEEKGIYVTDPNPNNILLTPNDDVCIIDFGPSYSDGFYPEERLHELVTGTIGIKTAMYMFFMLLRFIWNDGILRKGAPPPPPTRLRDRCPPRLLFLLDNPDAAEYSNFGELQAMLEEEPVWSKESE